VNKTKQLYDLQALDIEIETNEEALARVESQLGENPAIIEARELLAKERQHLAELEKSLRLGEGDVDDLRSKGAILEQKLYGGSVKNPKELMDLQEQARNVKKTAGDLENKLIDIMAETETVKAVIGTKAQELKGMEESWRQGQGRLNEEKAALSASLSQLEQARKDLAAKIDPISLELYEHLRDRRQGKAVAKVERGMCQGCRIVLATSELQRTRTGRKLIQCSSCERILYVS